MSYIPTHKESVGEDETFLYLGVADLDELGDVGKAISGSFGCSIIVVSVLDDVGNVQYFVSDELSNISRPLRSNESK